MMENSILICEDDVHIRKALTILFNKEGFTVMAASTGREAIRLVKEKRPEILLLDITLGDITGYEVMRELTPYKIPTILLSGRSEMVDKIIGLEMGADDYLTKPFDLRELVLRVKGLQRRSGEIKQSDSHVSKHHELEIDYLCKAVKKFGTPISLTPREFRIISYLAQNKGRVVDREELLTKIWGYDFYGDARTVDIQILRLRKKIEDNYQEPKYIVTVFGFGYKFDQ